jgi:hypothetical protein
MTCFKAFAHFTRRFGVGVLLSALAVAGGLAASSDHPTKRTPLVLEGQGAEAFGGKVLGDPTKGSVHCDHGYVEWQIPQSKQRKPALLMWHSASTKTWESPTPAGHEGFREIFLRRGYPVYIFDPPPSGRASAGCQPYSYAPRLGEDQDSFIGLRLGIWNPPDPPQPYPNLQFPVNNPAALEQLERANYLEFQTQENVALQSDAVADLLKKAGPAVLFTHSGSGVRGWWTAIKSENVKGIVAFEPGHFLFPQGEVPPPIPRADGVSVEAFNAPLGSAVPLADFMKLTKIPIRIIIGDNIPLKMDPINVGRRLPLENNRIRVIRVKLFVEAINRHGGHAEYYILPEHGITGNEHFIMWDLNNVKVADVVEEFLKKQGLDKMPAPAK